jgi:hypothetical protein
MVYLTGERRGRWWRKAAGVGRGGRANAAGAAAGAGARTWLGSRGGLETGEDGGGGGEVREVAEGEPSPPQQHPLASGSGDGGHQLRPSLSFFFFWQTSPLCRRL